MKEKALIKKTGEILDVENYFIYASISINIDMEEKLVEEIKSSDYSKSVWTFKDDSKVANKEGQHYHLSDGKQYHEDDLIVGLENIREFKLNEIL